jgi:hypothetical protein
VERNHGGQTESWSTYIRAMNRVIQTAVGKGSLYVLCTFILAYTKEYLGQSSEDRTVSNNLLTNICAAGAKVTVVTACGILVAAILKTAPEILEKTFRDGSTFRASESFLRKWLHDVMRWSPRKGM